MVLWRVPDTRSVCASASSAPKHIGHRKPVTSAGTCAQGGNEVPSVKVSSNLTSFDWLLIRSAPRHPFHKAAALHSPHHGTSSSQCTGIAPNPDIAGIGVRVAIYVQALLSVIYPIYFARDGEISAEESKTMSRVSINISLTVCVLLVSTVIQAAPLGISLYHTLIVLQLSWINGMTFMTVYSVARWASAVHRDSTCAKTHPCDLSNLYCCRPRR
ncbi:hypothetical protein C8R46DRAFT_295158 [Mycena filopes]|nr:hypothetical protein C8R46DRAFT_295158 [Mycena filopes]